MPGPVPKRTDERIGHQTQAQINSVTRIPGTSRKLAWFSPDPNWHSQARQIYDGLHRSAMAKTYQQSDVAVAFMVCSQLSDYLYESHGKGHGAQMFGSLMAALSELGATEGARRRLRIEIQSTDDPDATQKSAVQMAMDTYEEMLQPKAKSAPAA